MDPALLKVLGTAVAVGGLLLGWMVMAYAGARTGTPVLPRRAQPGLAGWLKFGICARGWGADAGALPTLRRVLGPMPLAALAALGSLALWADGWLWLALHRGTIRVPQILQYPFIGAILDDGLRMALSAEAICALSLSVAFRRVSRATGIPPADRHAALMVPAYCFGALLALGDAMMLAILDTRLTPLRFVREWMEGFACFVVVLVAANRTLKPAALFSGLFSVLAAWWAAKFALGVSMGFVPYVNRTGVPIALTLLYAGVLGKAWLFSESREAAGDGLWRREGPDAKNTT